MKLRTPFLLVVLALLLALVPLANAQDFGLSPEDMALLTEQDRNFSSVAANLSLSFSTTGSNQDVNIQFNGSANFGTDANSMPTGQATIDGTVDVPDETVPPISAEVRIVDGILYYNYANTGWQGMALTDLVSSLSSMSPIPVNPSDLASGDMSNNPEAMQAMGEIMDAFSNVDPTEFVSITRLDDMDGQAHFQIAIDVHSFLSSDAFTNLLTATSSMSGDSSSSAQMAQMAPMFAMMLQNPTLTVDQYISTDDHRLRQFELNLSFTGDPSMFGGDANASPVTVALNITIDGIDYDQPVMVEAPADATVMPSMSGQ